MVGAAIGAMVTWLALRGTFARRMAEGHASARAAAAAADARLQEADRRASDIASRLARAERELESTRARAEASTADCARLMAEVAAAAEKQALLETAEIKLPSAERSTQPPDDYIQVAIKPNAQIAIGIAGKHPHPMDKAMIPGCTYCQPQVASVGMTEAKAKEAGYELKIGRFPFVGNGKAIALGEPDGMVKTIFDKKTGQLLGAHLVGPEVTELIQGFVVAMNLETTEEELMHTIFPHPTLSETMKESVLDAYDRVLNM